MIPYPEHDKLQIAIARGSEKIGAFLEEYRHKGQEVSLCVMHTHDSTCYVEGKEGSSRSKLCQIGEGDYVPIHLTTNKVLAEYFGLDLAKIDAEKQAMLAAINLEITS